MGGRGSYAAKLKLSRFERRRSRLLELEEANVPEPSSSTSSDAERLAQIVTTNQIFGRPVAFAIVDEYVSLAREFGDHVNLAELKAGLFRRGFSEPTINRVLIELANGGHITLTPQEDRKRIRPIDRAAAVNFGGEPVHWISMN